jgi:hypothetical protein
MIVEGNVEAALAWKDTQKKSGSQPSPVMLP